MKKSILLFIGTFLLALPSEAQQVQKCCGTSNSTFLLGNISLARHSQCIYLPSDLTGAEQGAIHRLYYRYGSTGEDLGNTLTDLSIGMLQNQATAFTNSLFFTGVQNVFQSASFEILPGSTGEWFVIVLDTPFEYDPTLTLIIDIAFENSVTTNFGTLSTSMAGRKLYSADLTSPTGQSVVSSWQDMGFDLDATTSIVALGPSITTLVPNPAKDRIDLLLDSPLSSNGSAEILDMNGRAVSLLNIPSGITRTSIDVSAISSGTYILRIVEENAPARSRLFVRE